MLPWSIHHFIKKTDELNLTESSLKYLTDQLKLTNQYGLRNVFTLKDLAGQTNISYNFLRAIVGRKIRCYRELEINKKSGGKRTINIPSEKLDKVQKWISKYILSNINVHHCAYAYRKHYSIKDCALQHCCAHWIITMDIKDFFNNIYEDKIYKIFVDYGYNHLISFELARLCSLVDEMTETIEFDSDSEIRKNSKYSISHYNYLIQGHLPQGASSSPLLSNIVMYDIDEEIFKFCNDNNLVYTRYSDDLIFSSSDKNFTQENILLLKKKVKNILGENGFKLNNNKFSIQSPRSRKCVLGLLVDTEEPRATKHFRENVFSLLKSACKDVRKCYRQYKNNNPSKKYLSKNSFKKMIDGYMNYLHDVDFKRWEKNINIYENIQWMNLYT